jgi:hypothetical protein
MSPVPCSSIGETEVRQYELDKLEEVYDEEAWRECMWNMPTNPVKCFKIMYPNRRLPMAARLDGYDEDSDPYALSYGKFENQNLLDQLSAMSEDYERDIAVKNILIKNNIFVDKKSSKIGTINRVEMNMSDGYFQNTIIAGKTSDKNKHDFTAWNNDEAIYDNKDLTFVRPQIFANKVSTAGFDKKQIGSAQYFFEERDDFVEAWMGDEASTADALIVNDARNPEFIGFETKLTGVQAFDNILAYAQASGRPTFPDMCSVAIQINYFAHEVLNVLLPKQIVLVMDTYRGLIDIPKRDYIPNIRDPVLTVPDYNNRMMYVISMMKLIAQKGLFHPYVGNAYIKLSITPAIFVLNFISEYAQNLRLILAMGTVDNQVLFDAEHEKNVFPGQYVTRQTFYDGGKVISQLGENYYDRLMGMPEDEVTRQYASPYRYNSPGPTIYPASQPYIPSNNQPPMFGWTE